MSYYRAGALSLAGNRSKYSVGLLPGFVGTDDAKRELTLLNDEINGAGRELFDFTGDNPLSDPLTNWYARGGWQQFYKRWMNFYAGNKGLWSRFWSPGEIFRRTQDFRREYIALREYAESDLGMQWGSVAPRAALESPSVVGDLARNVGINDLLKYLAIGLLLVGGFIIILSFARG